MQKIITLSNSIKKFEPVIIHMSNKSISDEKLRKWLQLNKNWFETLLKLRKNTSPHKKYNNNKNELFRINKKLGSTTCAYLRSVAEFRESRW